MSGGLMWWNEDGLRIKWVDIKAEKKHNTIIIWQRKQNFYQTNLWERIY